MMLEFANIIYMYNNRVATRKTELAHLQRESTRTPSRTSTVQGIYSWASFACNHPSYTEKLFHSAFASNQNGTHTKSDMGQYFLVGQSLRTNKAYREVWVRIG